MIQKLLVLFLLGSTPAFSMLHPTPSHHGPTGGGFTPPSGGGTGSGSPGATPYSVPSGPSSPGGYGGSYGGGGSGSTPPPKKPSGFYPGLHTEIPMMKVSEWAGNTYNTEPSDAQKEEIAEEQARVDRHNGWAKQQNLIYSEMNWLNSPAYLNQLEQNRIDREKAQKARSASDLAQAQNYASKLKPGLMNAIALTQKKAIQDVQDRVTSNIDKSFHAQAVALNGEFSKWTSLDPNKRAAIALTDQYADVAQKFAANAGSINKDVYPYSESALRAGLDSLSETVQIAGGAPGDFSIHMEETSWMLDASKALLDVGLSMTPGVSFGKDLYEAYSGKSLIDGSDLGTSGRALAILGVVTVGAGDGVIAAAKGLNKLGHALKESGLVAKGFGKAGNILNSLKGGPSTILKASSGTGVATRTLADSKTMMRGTHQNAGLIPKEIGDQMTGKSYKNWDQFRKKFWKEVPNSKYASEFSPAQIAEMKTGKAPTAHSSQFYHGKKSNKPPITKYELHHIQPVQNGGGVYDVSNLAIVSPKVHKIILDPSVHCGKGKL